LSRIITADETCPHHYKPEMKRQSVEWHHLWTGTSWYREGMCMSFQAGARP
jgi:hypothetical protein